MRWAALALLAGCEEAEPTGPGTSEFLKIGFPGAAWTFAYGVNASGDVVGRYGDDADRTHGFLLREGVYTTIDFPGAVWTSALGINDAGHIVGRYLNADSSVSHGYLLNDLGYHSIDVPEATYTLAASINAGGNIVGWYVDREDRTHAFLMSDGRFTTIDIPGRGDSFGYGIGSSNEVVGETSGSGFLVQGIRLPMLIDFPGAPFTSARGIAPDGTIVGVYGVGSAHGFLLDDEFHRIDVPGSSSTILHSISADGRLVVGNYVDAHDNANSFLTTREEVLRWASETGDGGGTSSGPIVSQADPSVLPTRAALDVRILGSGFDDDSRVTLVRDGQASPEVQTRTVHFVSTKELIASLEIAPDAPLGSYDVQVEDRKGKQGIGTELIDIDSTSVSGIWDLTGRARMPLPESPPQDCALTGPMLLAQNDRDIQGVATIRFVCTVTPNNAPFQMPVAGTLDANGHDLLLTLGEPGCEFQGTHQGGSASGEILSCTNLADTFIAPADSAFSGTWQAQRR
jgi:probable HAF family extracellular repeat protein